MEKPALYTCSLCTLQFPSNNIRYASDGKKLICVGCFNKVYKKKQQDVTKEKSYEYPKEYPKQSLEPRATLNKPILVICMHCKYKFHYKANFKPICPYCGKFGLKKYEEFTAQKILNDSAKGDF